MSFREERRRATACNNGSCNQIHLVIYAAAPCSEGLGIGAVEQPITPASASYM